MARLRNVAVLLAAGALTEAVLVRLGRTYGSTGQERRMALPGDDIVADPQVVTNHAITIDAPADLCQSGTPIRQRLGSARDLRRVA